MGSVGRLIIASVRTRKITGVGMPRADMNDHAIAEPLSLSMAMPLATVTAHFGLVRFSIITPKSMT